jgi:hypothetical protein
MATGHKPAGGLHSRQVRHTTAPKVEPRARAINPSAVNQLGNFVGDHVTHRGDSTGYRGEPLVRGSGYNNPVGPSSMALSGPGAGREVMKSGQQSQHGGVAGSRAPQGRDILGSFGPESK